MLVFVMPHHHDCELTFGICVIVKITTCLFEKSLLSSGYYGCPIDRATVVSSFLFFFSSPNLGRRRLDVCHTSTHGVALVRI